MPKKPSKILHYQMIGLCQTKKVFLGTILGVGKIRQKFECGTYEYGLKKGDLPEKEMVKIFEKVFIKKYIKKAAIHIVLCLQSVAA